jgi:hypothetical protein
MIALLTLTLLRQLYQRCCCRRWGFYLLAWVAVAGWHVFLMVWNDTNNNRILYSSATDQEE